MDAFAPPADPAASTSRLRAYVLPLAACLALCAAIWVATAFAIGGIRRSIEHEAAAMRQNLAATLAEREASSMRAIDITLSFLRDIWTRDPAGFDRAVREHEAMVRKERAIQVAVVDARGDLLYSRLPVSPGLNFADRSYFAEHRDDARDRFRISEPVLGRVTGQWAIQLSRALRGPGGEFAGVIVMAVPPPALEHAFNEIDLGAKGVITLARSDGRILARSTDFPGSVGVVLPQAPGTKGEIESRGPVDGVRRLMAYSAVPEYGIVVYVGQAADTVLAPYARQRNFLVALATGASVLLLYVGLLLGERRRERARFEAERERVMLELHDGCIQSIYAIGLNLQGCRQLLRESGAEAGRIIAQAEADLNLVIQELRAFMSRMAPSKLTPQQLRAEIERSLPRAPGTGFALELDDRALDALDGGEAAEVLRIVREAAANVARHSGASTARISLRRPARRFELDIEDNGCGIDSATPSAGGLGLAHIAARARKLKGSAHITALEGGGTRVSVRFPETT